MNDKSGKIHIYTGDGKGKSTAAAGQALRAAAAGFKVALLYFCKEPRSGAGETGLLEKCGIRAEFYARGHPGCGESPPLNELRKDAAAGMDRAAELLQAGSTDMLILDEVIVAVRDGIIREEDIFALMDQAREETFLILTGRGATGKMIEKAELVSRIEDVKHPFKKGVRCRTGIEI